MSPPVSQFTTTPVLSVDRELSVADATDAMAQKDIHSLVVVTEDHQAAGVFTSTDLIAAVADGVDLTETTVADWMTDDVVTVSPDDDITSVASLMQEHDIGHVPVVDGRVIGIVSESDLRTYLAD